MSVKLLSNNSLKELREENNRLFYELLFAKKLLQNYRNFLNQLFIDYKCDQNIENKLKFNELENEFKTVFNNYKNNRNSVINEEIDPNFGFNSEQSFESDIDSSDEKNSINSTKNYSKNSNKINFDFIYKVLIHFSII
jgi:hypothetical protein